MGAGGQQKKKVGHRPDEGVNGVWCSWSRNYMVHEHIQDILGKRDLNFAWYGCCDSVAVVLIEGREKPSMCDRCRFIGMTERGQTNVLEVCGLLV